MTETSRIGWLFGESKTPAQAAMLRVDNERTTLEIPMVDGLSNIAMGWFVTEQLPESVVYVDPRGTTALSGLHIKKYSELSSTPIRHGVLDAASLVECRGNHVDFTNIHGMRTELAGLSKWMQPKVFEYQRESDSQGRLKSVSFHVKDVQPTQIEGVPNLRLAPHFSVSHDFANGVHSMSETMQIETLFSTPRPWKEHVRIHRTLQDLIALCFWYPCELAVKTVTRNEDQLLPVDDTGYVQVWNHARMPTAGRGRRTTTLDPLPSDLFPLFTFHDIGTQGLSRWYQQYDKLGQAMWVLAASLYHKGATVEVQLLQVGTALEALGYEIAARTGRVKEGKRDFSFTYIEAVRLICEETDCSLSELLNDEDPEDWAASFNTVYKGVKHADNRLPDPDEALIKAWQGALLVRVWLARELGVARDRLEERIPMHTLELS